MVACNFTIAYVMAKNVELQCCLHNNAWGPLVCTNCTSGASGASGLGVLGLSNPSLCHMSPPLLTGIFETWLTWSTGVIMMMGTHAQTYHDSQCNAGCKACAQDDWQSNGLALAKQWVGNVNAMRRLWQGHVIGNAVTWHGLA